MGNQLNAGVQKDSENTERCAPLVSVVLLAYNHLAYTKLCVESLIRHTHDVNYELITVDNGSSDGTKEFFESLPNSKKLSFPENIGVDCAVNKGFRLAEGKYVLNLSNDIVVTSRWLSNLVACMESDERIAMAVPVCGFSSNGQQVDLSYATLDEMQKKAEAFNRSNPDLWEDRLKLVTYACLFRRDAFELIGGFDEAFNPGAYDDDAIGFLLRRRGYRLILAKDTYVHHFGSVTFNEEYRKNNIAVRNRTLFFRKFGVDSWGASTPDAHVVKLAGDKKKGEILVLGVGQSCGASLLQIKNGFRKSGNRKVKLYYLTEAARSLPDLATICEFCTFGVPEDVKRYFSGRLYDLIVVESETRGIEDRKSFYTALASLLKEKGSLITTAAEGLYPEIEETLRANGLVPVRSLEQYYYLFEKRETVTQTIPEL